MNVQIDQRAIGIGQPTFVIAEIGVNHDGSLARALQLVDIAAECGADAVKLQLFSADRLMSSQSAFAAYQQDRSLDANPSDMLRRYELPPLEVAQVVAAIRHRGLIPLATPFSIEDVHAIRHLRLPAIKIASPDSVNQPLLAASAGLGVPLLVSTGAAAMEEVATTVGWLGDLGASFALLHCVSSYPTPADQLHLSWIGELADAFGVPVGYSDHSTETMSGALAVAAGACMVERHLTYDKSAVGPDHAASSDPAEFAAYVRLIRHAEVMRGCGPKRVLDIEQDVRRVSRQSLFLARDIAPGEVLDERAVRVQRPGTGIPAAALSKAIGRRVKCRAARGEPLRWDLLEGVG